MSESEKQILYYQEKGCYQSKHGFYDVHCYWANISKERSPCSTCRHRDERQFESMDWIHTKRK